MNERVLTTPILAEMSVFIHAAMSLAEMMQIFLGTMNAKTDPILVDRMRTIRKEIAMVRASVRALRDDFDGHGLDRVRRQNSGELEPRESGAESKPGEGANEPGNMDAGL